MDKEMNILRERYYVDEKKTEPTWKIVRNHPIILKYIGKDPLTVSIMATVIGYHKGLRIPGSFNYSSGGWMQNVQQGTISESQQNAIAIIVAIAVKEEGIEILNQDVKVIQNIAHEFGNGGVHELLKILNLESETVVMNKLLSIMRKPI